MGTQRQAPACPPEAGLSAVAPASVAAKVGACPFVVQFGDGPPSPIALWGWVSFGKCNLGMGLILPRQFGDGFVIE